MSGRCAAQECLEWRWATSIWCRGASRSCCGLPFLGVVVACGVAGWSRAPLSRCRGATAIAFDVHLQDDGVVDEAVDCRKRHSGIRKDARPFAEGLIGSDQQAAALVA